MRLKYKPQSTLFTCNQATQAIALNSLLGTDFTDLDIVRASDKGYPLDLTVLQYISRQGSHPPQATYVFATGTYRLFRDGERSLPSMEKCIEAYIRWEESMSQKYAERVRSKRDDDAEENIARFNERQEREIMGAREMLTSPDVAEAFQKFSERLNSGLLEPIGYHFTVQAEQADDVSGLDRLSNGRLADRPLEGFDSTLVAHPGRVVRFSSYRTPFNMPQLFDPFMHWWAVDREDDGNVILLDTNAHTYGHQPEVRMPKENVLDHGKHWQVIFPTD